MNDTDIAYIAGLFDGEGSVTFGFYRSSKNGKRYGRLQARISNTDKPCLEWVKAKIGAGRIYVKDKRKNNLGINPENLLPCYDLQLVTAQARTFLGTILPFLKIKKGTVQGKLNAEAIYKSTQNGQRGR